jgi:hypothetical protein
LFCLLFLHQKQAIHVDEVTMPELSRRLYALTNLQLDEENEDSRYLVYCRFHLKLIVVDQKTILAHKLIVCVPRV